MRTVATLAVAAMVVAACGGGSDSSAPAVGDDWDTVVENAEAEGTVMLYSNLDPAVLDQIKDKFTKKYPGITMEYTFGLTTEIQPKLEAEKQTNRGVGDVLLQSDPIWVKNNPDYFTAAIGPSFENEDYDQDAYFSDGTTFAVANSVMGIAWNTDEVPEGISDYDELLDDKFKGRIGIMRPTGAVVCDYYAFLQDNYGDDYLERLGELDARIYATSIAISQGIASGEIWATPYSQPQEAQKKAGAPIDWTTPTQTWGGRYIGQVLSSAPNPNAAQLLADFLVTPEAQSSVVLQALPVLPDTPGAAASPDAIQLADPEAWTPDEVEACLKEWDGWIS